MIPQVSSADHRIDLQFQSPLESWPRCRAGNPLHLSGTDNGKARNTFFTQHDQEKKKTEFIQNEIPSFEKDQSK